MIKQMGIRFEKLTGEAADSPFSIASGGGVIFGATGGVTEAVLRHLAEEKNYKSLNAIGFTGVRGEEGIKEATAMVGDREVRIAIVHGLANAGKLLDAIKSGEKQYDFVEVMACRRGCIMGGGQPAQAGPRTRKGRMEGLYKVDAASSIRYTDDNPAVKQLYTDLLVGKEHKLLHRNLEH